MIIPSVILFYKLLKRFPQVIILVYGAFLFVSPFSGTQVETETEVIEYYDQQQNKVEVNEQDHVLDLFTFSFFPLTVKNYLQSPMAYVKSTFHKLYILYSQFLIDRRSTFTF